MFARFKSMTNVSLLNTEEGLRMWTELGSRAHEQLPLSFLFSLTFLPASLACQLRVIGPKSK